MEVDTGSALSIVSWSTLKQIIPHFKKQKLQNCYLTLRDYQGASIPIVGTGKFLAQFQQFRGQLPLLIVDGSLPSLLGLDWFPALGLHVRGILSIATSKLDKLYTDYADVFSEGLGCYVGTPISFNVDASAVPVRLKPHRVPFAVRPKLDQELDKLIN
uniref:Peptidase A2 domain-containing protein n=1 Tax=Micrurus spixii TaxID=129469 RepID=A0A2D4LWC9_9SAUR